MKAPALSFQPNFEIAKRSIEGEEWSLRVTVLSTAEECKSEVEKITQAGKKAAEVTEKTGKIIFERVKRQRG